MIFEEYPIRENEGEGRQKFFPRRSCCMKLIFCCFLLVFLAGAAMAGYGDIFSQTTA
jgi:hypothetical protein